MATHICTECSCPYDNRLIGCPECGCPNEQIEQTKKVRLSRQEYDELNNLHQFNLHVAEQEANALIDEADRKASKSLWSSLKRAYTRCDNFKGRSRRGEFWTFVAFNCLVCTVLYMVLFASIGRDYITISEAPTENEYWHRLISSCLSNHLLVTLLILGYMLVILLPLLSVTVRRLHDTNHSGLWILLGIVPFVLGLWAGFSPYIGLLLLAVMLLLDSTPDNKYGRRIAN